MFLGYREKVMTPEMIKKAALKSQKRKQLQDEKREKDKVHGEFLTNLISELHFITEI